MKTRDILYMIHNDTEQSVTSMGMEFREFVSSLATGLQHVLLLESGYFGHDFHIGHQLEYVTNPNLPDLYQDNVYSYGNFCWVDFNDIPALDLLEPQEIAELLYLGHLKKPMHRPFWDKLGNRFAYLAHDDGWYNKIYYRDRGDYTAMLRNLFSLKLKGYTKKAIPPLSQAAAEQLMEHALGGVLIQMHRTLKSRSGVEIPYIVIGRYTDFDDVYNSMERYIGRARNEHWLICKNGEWSIKSYS